MKWKKTLFFMVVGITMSCHSAWAEDGKPQMNTIHIGEMTCKQLMAGSDLDREVGIAFFHGYFSGKSGNQIVNLPQTSAVSTFVRDFCLSNPDSTVMEAFAKAPK